MPSDSDFSNLIARADRIFIKQGQLMKQYQRYYRKPTDLKNFQRKELDHLIWRQESITSISQRTNYLNRQIDQIQIRFNDLEMDQ